RSSAAPRPSVTVPKSWTGMAIFSSRRKQQETFQSRRVLHGRDFVRLARPRQARGARTRQNPDRQILPPASFVAAALILVQIERRGCRGYSWDRRQSSDQEEHDLVVLRPRSARRL